MGIDLSRSLCLAVLTCTILSPINPVQAQTIGDSIVNPDTGQSETVGIVFTNGLVVTEEGNTISILSPGDTFVNDDGVAFDVVDRRSVEGRFVLDLVESAPAGGVPPISETVSVVVQVAEVPDGLGYLGDEGGLQPFVPPAGAQNVRNITQVGSNGADGRDGFGFSLFGQVIGRSARTGRLGGIGPDIITILTGNPILSGDSNETPGVTVVSRGGNGGEGGDAFLSANINAAQGGRAGNGGTVDVTNNHQVTTSGELSHGILSQSVAGRGGDGGDAFITIAGSGGSGGPPSEGGEVTVTNNGRIQVSGDLSSGILAQSFGGFGGEGGNGFGLVGEGGSASEGGNGGDVAVVNNGEISTGGLSGFGINAQSIGGSGGNGGDAVGLVAFGGDSEETAGGDGGDVLVRNTEGGNISTTGDSALGVLGQSIGGGGGSGGSAGGIAAFGGQGAAGGNAGNVQILNEAGGAITTSGGFSHGIVGQSIGGGGGIGGGSTGAVALGGSGAGGGLANQVEITTGGSVLTSGAGAKGVIAQSIGGGGGASNQTGGIVSVGGQGGVGGDGAAVFVSNSGVIRTGINGGADDADGIFAQSIGGGGGIVSGSGAILAAIGGSGGDGGDGGDVTVTHAGLIETDGVDAAGIHAQSIGGGGGSGGDAAAGKVGAGVRRGG